MRRAIRALLRSLRTWSISTHIYAYVDWVLWEVYVIRCTRDLLGETPVKVKEEKAGEGGVALRVKHRSNTFEGEGAGRSK